MRKIACLIGAPALMFMGVLAIPARADTPAATPRVGVIDSPCAALPPAPPEVTDYLKRALLAKARGEALPPPSAEGLQIYGRWQQALTLADHAGLCRYRAANATLPPAGRDRILFMGDSITENWLKESPAFFARGERVDRGISGQTSAQMLGRFQADVVALKPAVVHILAGTNDIAGNGGPTDVAAITDNIRSMVQLARANGIAVVLATVPPARRFDWRPEIEPRPAIAALNGWIRDYARAQGLALADYHAVLDDGDGGLTAADAADGVHPTAAGYARMEAVTEQALAQAARQPRARPSR